jgi:hypothetical protein
MVSDGFGRGVKLRGVPFTWDANFLLKTVD